MGFLGFLGYTLLLAVAVLGVGFGFLAQSTLGVFIGGITNWVWNSGISLLVFLFMAIVFLAAQAILVAYVSVILLGHDWPWYLEFIACAVLYSLLPVWTWVWGGPSWQVAMVLAAIEWTVCMITAVYCIIGRRNDLAKGLVTRRVKW